MASVSLQIASNSAVPIYRQIVDQVRTHIESGALAPGEALPSVRSIATQLGIHFNTAAEAYRELAEEGSISLNRGRRAIVRSSGSTPAASHTEAEDLLRRLRHLVAEMRLKGLTSAAIRDQVEAVVWR